MKQTKEEKFLETKQLDYNRAIKNDLGEYVSIGDIIKEFADQETKELKELLGKNENTINHLNSKFNEAYDENTKLKAEIEELKSKLEIAIKSNWTEK